MAAKYLLSSAQNQRITFGAVGTFIRCSRLSPAKSIHGYEQHVVTVVRTASLWLSGPHYRLHTAPESCRSAHGILTSAYGISHHIAPAVRTTGPFGGWGGFSLIFILIP